MKKSDAGSKKALLQRPAAAKAPADPAYSYTHWDYVMMEMKWMAQDFMQVHTQLEAGPLAPHARLFPPLFSGHCLSSPSDLHFGPSLGYDQHPNIFSVVGPGSWL